MPARTSWDEPLPPSFTATRESLRTLACYVLGPAARARTGHIWLTPHQGGIAAPNVPGVERVGVVEDRLVRGDASVAITNLRDAAMSAGVELVADPQVGRDLPPFHPTDALTIDPSSSRMIGAWYHFAAGVLDSVRERLGDTADVGASKLWPEHFDLALTVEPVPGGAIGGAAANVGCSPGDGFSDDPYLYVGPWDTTNMTDTTGTTGEIWNAPFGATITRSELATRGHPGEAAGDFVRRALAALGWALGGTV